MTLQHICKCGEDGYNQNGGASDDGSSLEYFECVFCGQLWTRQKNKKGDVKWCPFIVNIHEKENSKIEKKVGIIEKILTLPRRWFRPLVLV